MQGAKVALTRILAAAFALALTTLGGTAGAQQAGEGPGEADIVAAFSGGWQVFDDRYKANSSTPCRLDLGDTPSDGRYPVRSQGCAGVLADVREWGIDSGQMTLFSEEQEIVVRLGGNQRRMTGNAVNGAPIILDSVGGNQLADQVQVAVQNEGCVYYGFTDRCARPAELSEPEGEDASNLNVIVNLNVRAEARADAELVGVVPQDTCIAADLCATAADGVWCRAQFGERSGWMRQTAIRRNRWPVLTYTTGCTQE